MPHAHFQKFTTDAEPERSASRFAALRAELARQGVEGLLLPRADIFQGEYIPASENRLKWLTAFTGSAGFAIILKTRAALFVDGRYTVQAKAEVDGKVIKTVPLADRNPDEWLRDTIRPKARIGYDPALFTARGLKRFETAALTKGFSLVALKSDPFAAIWEARPAAPATPVVDHPFKFAGEEAAEKIARLQKRLTADGIDAVVISECPSVNWLFNIRAGDVPHLPILRAFALVPQEGRPTLLVDPKRLEASLAARLSTLCNIIPTVAPPHDGRVELIVLLDALGKAGARIRLDEDTAPALLGPMIEVAGGKPVFGPCPLALMKSPKNAIEIEGSRAAHLRDGAAMVRFLAWLDREAPKGKITEIDTAIALEGFRRETGELVDVSFPSIAGAGPNAALPHYRVTEATNRALAPGLFLIDSGGQYRDGTTDITRTIAVVETTRAMRDAYTRVLKGMIAISLALFPKGTSGGQIDAFARQFLWSAGKDFDHGTGHGVGSYLSVHEGPQRISKLGGVPLQPGMILSNEPGYYREGKFGIRIENLVVVEPRAIKGAEREIYGFETLTYCPIDTRPIIRSMLTRPERDWLNAYHAETYRRLSPLVKGADLSFLEAACRPL
ncbi:MAG: X-Pro aminopeptidase [Rhizobiales bacterium PAR1]|nr:MAG: X-Pro aminopeptidase [Rhizobiales bacterium PAR1]